MIPLLDRHRFYFFYSAYNTVKHIDHPHKGYDPFYRKIDTCSHDKKYDIYEDINFPCQSICAPVTATVTIPIFRSIPEKATATPVTISIVPFNFVLFCNFQKIAFLLFLPCYRILSPESVLSFPEDHQVPLCFVLTHFHYFLSLIFDKRKSKENGDHPKRCQTKFQIIVKNQTEMIVVESPVAYICGTA